MTFAPVRFSVRITGTTGAVGAAGSFGGSPDPPCVRSPWIGVGTASAMRACRRGSEDSKFFGVVFGSSCGRISLSIAAGIAPGSTNT